MNQQTEIKQTMSPSFHTPDIAGSWEAPRTDVLRLFVLAVSAVLLAGTSALASENDNQQVTISTLEELEEYAGKSGNRVRMEAGKYRLTDYITTEKLSEMNQKIERANTREGKREAAEFISFNGDDNVFDLRGVTIEFDTELRAELDQIIHSSEFVLPGNNNILQGLTIVNIGDGASKGGCVLNVTGDGNTLREWKLVVRGSYPYGYGDLFGFGGKPSQRLKGLSVKKHSGIRIAGDNNRFLGCHIDMRSLGHAFYLQDNARDTYLEDCHVEGRMRPTDDMLAETSGPAYELGFRAIAARGGRIKPGYVKSLSEDAFRFYSAGKTTFVNCTAKNMRKGFAVTRGGPAYLENCVAIGCGDGFRVGGADDVLKNCRGDAKYGPLLILAGGGSPSVELELMPAESDLKGWRQNQGVAVIGGEKGRVLITPWQEKERRREKPITLGWRAAQNITLTNKTSMPVVITEKARDCRVYSKGEVLRNDGENVEAMPIGFAQQIQRKIAKSVVPPRSKYLLLDHRLIADSDHARLSIGTVKKHSANPLFGQELPWETDISHMYPNVIDDRREQVYKIWYYTRILDWKRDVTPGPLAPEQEGQGNCATLYATSKDGIRWEKPGPDLYHFNGKPTNIVVCRDHGAGIFKDPHDPDPSRRYKLIRGRMPRGTIDVAFLRMGSAGASARPWPRPEATRTTTPCGPRP